MITFLPRSFVRFICTVILAIFVSEEVLVGAVDGSFSRCELQVESSFNPIGGAFDSYRFSIEGSLMYILKGTDIVSFDKRITLFLKDNDKVVIDFEKKQRSNVQGEEWIIPVCVITPIKNVLYNFDAVILSDKAIEIRSRNLKISPQRRADIVDTKDVAELAQAQGAVRDEVQYAQKETAIQEEFKIAEKIQEWLPAVSILGGSRVPKNSREYEKVEELAREFAARGVALRTGAGPGVMEAGLSPTNLTYEQRQGVKIDISAEDKINPNVGIRADGFKNFPPRKKMMWDNSYGAALALGGLGSVDECWEWMCVGLPVVFYDKQYWTPILQAFTKSMGKEGFYISDNLYRITDSPKEAADFLLYPGVKPLVFDRVSSQKALDLALSYMRTNSHLKPSIVITGEISKTSAITREVEKLTKMLISRGDNVRCASQGGLFEKLSDVAREENFREQMDFTILLSRTQQQPEIIEGYRQYFTADISAHHIVATENASAHVFTPGGLYTMNQFFNLLVGIQCGLVQRKPIVLIGREFWTPIINMLFAQILRHYNFGLMAERDTGLVTIVDTAEEAYWVAKGLPLPSPVNTKVSESFGSFSKGITGGNSFSRALATIDLVFQNNFFSSSDLAKHQINPVTGGNLSQSTVVKELKGLLILGLVEKIDYNGKSMYRLSSSYLNASLEIRHKINNILLDLTTDTTQESLYNKSTLIKNMFLKREDISNSSQLENFAGSFNVVGTGHFSMDSFSFDQKKINGVIDSVINLSSVIDISDKADYLKTIGVDDETLKLLSNGSFMLVFPTEQALRYKLPPFLTEDYRGNLLIGFSRDNKIYLPAGLVIMKKPYLVSAVIENLRYDKNIEPRISGENTAHRINTIWNLTRGLSVTGRSIPYIDTCLAFLEKHDVMDLSDTILGVVDPLARSVWAKTRVLAYLVKHNGWILKKGTERLSNTDHWIDAVMKDNENQNIGVLTHQVYFHEGTPVSNLVEGLSRLGAGTEEIANAYVDKAISAISAKPLSKREYKTLKILSSVKEILLDDKINPKRRRKKAMNKLKNSFKIQEGSTTGSQEADSAIDIAIKMLKGGWLSSLSKQTSLLSFFTDKMLVVLDTRFDEISAALKNSPALFELMKNSDDPLTKILVVSVEQGRDPIAEMFRKRLHDILASKDKDKIEIKTLSEIIKIPTSRLEIIRELYEAVATENYGTRIGLEIIEGVVYSRYSGLLLELVGIDHLIKEGFEIIHTGKEIFDENGVYVSEIDVVIRDPRIGGNFFVEVKSVRSRISPGAALRGKVKYKLREYKDKLEVLENVLGLKLSGAMFILDIGSNKNLSKYFKKKQKKLEKEFGMPVSFRFMNMGESVRLVTGYTKSMLNSLKKNLVIQPSYIILMAEKAIFKGTFWPLRMILAPLTLPHEAGNLLQAYITGRWRDLTFKLADIFSGLRYEKEPPLCIGGTLANIAIGLGFIAYNNPWAFIFGISQLGFASIEIAAMIAQVIFSQDRSKMYKEKNIQEIMVPKSGELEILEEISPKPYLNMREEILPKISSEEELARKQNQDMAKLDKEDTYRIRNLANQNDLAKSILESLLSLSLSKKTVIALDNGLALGQSSQVLAVIREIERLKKIPRYDRLLANLKFISKTPEHIVLELKNMEDKNNRVFIFSRFEKKDIFSSLGRDTNLIFISESPSEEPFPCDAYYPLAEIIAITLSQYFDKNTLLRLEDVLVKLNIESVDEKDGVLVFHLLPIPDRYDTKELLKKYAILKRMLIAA